MATSRPDLMDRPEATQERVVVCRIGRVQYGPVWELQHRLQARLVAAKKQAPALYLPHVLLLLEHNPVFTLGKSGNENNLVWDRDQRESEGVELHRVDRGGDVTFHGPGQLVGYPILDLDRFFTDIHRYLRELEKAVILTLQDAGLTGGRFPGRTGVWIGPDNEGPERKICAMGVRCSRWVTMHGFALNVKTELGSYEGIVPCGIDDRGVTSMARELSERGGGVSMEQAMGWMEVRFAEAFDCTIDSLEGEDAWAFLADFLQADLAAASYVS